MLVVLLLPALTSHRCPRASLLRIHALLLSAPLTLAGLGTMRAAGLLSGATWFAATGVAIFCGYIPVTALFFDKLVGALRLNGTAAGFIQARRDRSEIMRIYNAEINIRPRRFILHMIDRRFVRTGG